MEFASTETYVAWITRLLLLGFGLAAIAGVLTLVRSRRLRYFHVRREAVVRGWRLLIISAGMLAGAGLSFGLGVPLIRLAVPPTLPATASLPPSPTVPPPSLTPSATASVTATRTETAGPSPTPSDTPTGTVTPTPELPGLYITSLPGATVTPPAQAAAGSVRFSLRDNCNVETSTAFFDQLPKTIYAHFFYNNWLPGVQWSGVWLRDGQVFYAETRLWDGSTGGCGFSDYDNAKNWWPEGVYEVQIFVGQRWLTSNRFEVWLSSPTPTNTLNPPPRPPTATLEPTATRTPRPTAAPSDTPGPTATRTPRPTVAPSDTPSRTPVPTNTIFPFGVIGLAVVDLPEGSSVANLRAAAPDGAVIALLPEGTPVTMLVEFEVHAGTVWRRVRLENDQVGWIPQFYLRQTAP
ncbi:MAG: hypothetical protein IT318_12980 [Anaerolineales bacterium]|nr:hypothetical protein [Anaerolineales bacterium]